MTGRLNQEVIKACDECGEPYVAVTGRQRYCGSYNEKTGCSWKNRNRRNVTPKPFTNEKKAREDFRFLYGREGSERELRQFLPYWRFNRREKRMWGEVGKIKRTA